MQKQVPRIKPSQRPKKRYVLFQASLSERFSSKDFSKELWLALVKKLGKEEALSLGFQLVVFDSFSGKGIFKCKREECAKAVNAVNLLKELAGKKASLKTLSTSGTMLSLKEKMKK